MHNIILSSGKSVLAPPPYQPNEWFDGPLIGRETERRMLLAAWLTGGAMPPLCPLLVGDPGLGKNRLVYELARLCGRPLYIIQGHEDITAEDLACTVRFRDDDSRGVQYVVSPLVAAMHQGGICFIDEIGKFRPRALALLASVLDDRRYIDSSLLGERVQASAGFRFVAATNQGEEADLPRFIRSRLRPLIQFGFPAKEEINHIIAQHLPTHASNAGLLDAFWEIWHRAEQRPTPRDALHHFALASRLADCEGAAPSAFLATGNAEACAGPAKVAQVAEGGLCGVMKIDHLQQAFTQLFVPQRP